MARQVTLEPSRTLAEFRLLPGLTNREHAFEKVSLVTVLTERPGQEHRAKTFVHQQGGTG